MSDQVTELQGYIEYLEELEDDDDDDWMVVSPNKLNVDIRYSYKADAEKTQMTVEGVGYFDWKTFTGRGLDALGACNYHTFSVLVIPKRTLSDEALNSSSDDTE